MYFKSTHFDEGEAWLTLGCSVFRTTKSIIISEADFFKNLTGMFSGTNFSSYTEYNIQVNWLELVHTIL